MQAMARRWMLTALSVLALAGGTAQAAPLKVVATISILGDMVSQVGGEDVAVKTLVAPGSDAHVYQPSPADAKSLADADVVVENGLGLEGWIERLIAASGTKAPIVVASQGVKAQTMVEEDAHGGGKRVTDPHAWQDLANGQRYARTIAEGLAKRDPDHADAYRRRAEDYAAQLATLDGWVRQQIATVPPAKRKIITSHDAFGYFGRAYGVTLQAPVGISTESEPTAAELGRLAKQVKREKIKALFIETMTDPRLIETLARESGAVVGGALYSDSLSEPGGPADTYVKMFQHNVPEMVAAMQKN